MVHPHISEQLSTTLLLKAARASPPPVRYLEDTALPVPDSISVVEVRLLLHKQSVNSAEIILT